MEYKDTYNKPNDRNECDDLITDAHVSDALRHALIDLWAVNPHLPDTSALPNFRPRPQNQQRHTAVIDDQSLPQLQVTPDGLTRFLPLSTNLPLKNKRKMLYFPMDFGEINIDGLIDTGALSSVIPEAELLKIRLLAPHTILNEGPPPEFQIMVANGQSEAPIATVELQFEVGDITFREKFIVMTNLTSPLIGLLFLQRNSTIFDKRQGILNFPFFSMQLKKEDRTYPNVFEPILNPLETILQPGKRTTIWAKSQIYTDNEATGIIQPLPLLENDEDLLICPAISSTQNKKHMVQHNNFLDHPYTLKKGTHMAKFSILTPEQTKHIRPVNPTSKRHLLNNSHDDAIHYINSLLKTSKNDEVTEPSRILIEQDSDPTLLNFKREMLGLPIHEEILLNDARYMHYSRNKKRIIIKDDILYRKYYNDIGEVRHLQVLLPGQLFKVLLQSLHGTAGKHPGISKMMQEIRQKYYFPSIATYVRNWVRDCEICIQDKGINNTRITPELIHIPEWDFGPEYLMQSDLLPELPPSGGYEKIITAIDVFSRYAFAYPVSNPTAVNTAKVIIDIMTRHTYLPTLIIPDKGGVFVSQVIHEVAELLSINLKHATTKQAQTIGVLERAHGTIRTSFKMASGEYRKQWHKFLPNAILNYKTTYHFSIDCEPSRVFHGRVPHNILDHKLDLRFNRNITPTTDFVEKLLRRTKLLYDKTKKNVMQSYIKHKKYYDKKAKASPLKEKDYCFILQPKADHQG